MRVVLFSIVMTGGVALLQKWFFSKFVHYSEVSARLSWCAVIWGAFGAGTLSTIATILVGGSLGSDGLSNERKFYELGILGPGIEEFAKGLAPIVAAWWCGLRGKRALMVVGALSGVGFFLMETSLALILAAKSGSDAWGHEFAFRAVGFCLLHPSCSALFGLGVGVAANRKGIVSVVAFVFFGYLAAFLPHFWNNSLALMINIGHTKEGWEYAFGLQRTFLISWVILYLFCRWRRRGRAPANT